MFGHQLCSHVRILDDIDRCQADRLQLAANCCVIECLARFDSIEDRLSDARSRMGIGSEELELLLRIRIVIFRENPIRGALKEMNLACEFGHFRYELHRARGGANDANSFALERVRPIPS